MKTLDLVIPEFWLPALFNGDLSGFSDEDLRAYDEFVNDMLRAFNKCEAIDSRDNVGFVKYHDVQSYGVLTCNCVTVNFDVTDTC